MKLLWNDVINSVTHKEEFKQQIHRVLTRNRYRAQQAAKNRKMYMIGESFPNIYFTQREVDTMRLLVQGFTIQRAAESLGLSHRTVEYYVKNMKLKLGCVTKSKLIEIIMKSNFTRFLK